MQWKQSSKVNRIRTFALSLVFIGIAIMYIAIFLNHFKWIMGILMVLGVLTVLSSAGVYAWIGMLSTKAIIVQCPNCEKYTKVLGKVDVCMSCRQPLTLDRDLEGKELDARYNRKSYTKKAEGRK